MLMHQNNDRETLYVEQMQVERPRPDFMKPHSGLTLAIISTILCCLPLGIVAILRAVKVNRLWEAGFYRDAERYASSAKRWAIFAIIIGAIVNIAAFCCFVFYVAVEEALNSGYDYDSRDAYVISEPKYDREIEEASSDLFDEMDEEYERLSRELDQSLEEVEGYLNDLEEYIEEFEEYEEYDYDDYDDYDDYEDYDDYDDYDYYY